ncbi:hypothetical protein [Pseudosulfitobacter pseudonitzschiae]|uniref:hypothetical protein n=1 Tax=Pseudosulfitobacter pseudonitzschiae TaxID=1402135 RepID=UPI003B821605
MEASSLRIRPDDVVAPAWEGICLKCESQYFCEEQAEDPGCAPCPSCVSENDPAPGHLRWTPIIDTVEYPDLSSQPDHFRSWGPWTIWDGQDNTGPEIPFGLSVQVFRRSRSSGKSSLPDAGSIVWIHKGACHDVMAYRVETLKKDCT